MPQFFEAILALVGLVAVIVVAWLWLVSQLDGGADDAQRVVSRIAAAAHEAHMGMAREELRQSVEQLERHHVPQPSHRNAEGARER